MCDQENSTDDADDADDGYEIFFLAPAAHAYDMATKVREANEALLSDNNASPPTRMLSRKVTFREENLASYADEVSTDDVSDDVTSISDDEELCWGQADPAIPTQAPLGNGDESDPTTETHHGLLESWSPFVQHDSEVYVEEPARERPNSAPRRIRPKSATKSNYARSPSAADDTSDYDENDSDDEGVQTILSEDVDEEEVVDEILSDIQDGSTPMDSSEVFDAVPPASPPPLRTLQLSPSSQSVDSSPPHSQPEPEEAPNNEEPKKATTLPPPPAPKAKAKPTTVKRVQTAPTPKGPSQPQQNMQPQPMSQQRNCCNSARRPRLPAYNGLNSEYGLSAEQLQERERIGEARRLARRLRQQEHKAEQDARRRLSEALFKEWLRRKSVSDTGVCIPRDLHTRDHLPCKRLAAALERNRQKVSGPPATGSSSSVEASSSNPSTESSSRGFTPGLRYPGRRSRPSWKRMSDPHTVAIEDLVRGAPPRLLAACRIYLGLTVR